ncbi:MAG: disulfide oxidoreductase [Candidatus Limnocylindria bacterium]
MSLLAVSTFLAVLALAVAAGAIGLLLWAAASRFASGPAEAPQSARAGLGPLALWLAFAVALVSTLGSLYLSEVARFVPCTLCWYQRIAMYPLALLLGIAAVRGDLGVRRYAVPVAGIGALIAAYHVALQRLPGLPSGSCSLDVPCSAIYIERFGFVTIPVMALIGFVATVVTLTVLTPRRSDS